MKRRTNPDHAWRDRKRGKGNLKWHRIIRRSYGGKVKIPV